MTAAQHELVCVVRRTDGRTEWLTDLSFFLSFILARGGVSCACVWRMALWPCAGVLPVWRGPRSRRDAIYKSERAEERAWSGLETRLEAEGGARGDLLAPLLPRKAVALSRATTERSGTHHLCPQSHRAAASTDGGDDAAAPFAGRASTLAAQAEPGVRRQCVRLLKHPPTQALSPHCAQSPIDSLALMWQATSRGAATLGHLER